MEVFKCGKHTDSGGNTREWKTEDLDKIVDKFKELGEDVPATIGHPNTDTAPAFGWFKKVWRDGCTLSAELTDVVEEFGDMLKKKMFKNRSIALRPDMSLRHVAFLGAAAPAVKGMKDFDFSQDEFTTIEFEESTETESRVLARIEKLFSEIKTYFKPENDQLLRT